MTISDKKIVTVGSVNFTKSAQTKNDEIFMEINDKPSANSFTKQFEAMWNDNKGYKKF